MRVVFSLFISLVLTAFTFVPADVKFEYVFKKGDRYEVHQETKQIMKQTIMGGEQNFDNSFSADYSFVVSESTPNGAKIEIRYVRLKNELKSTMINSLMDSEGKAESTENKIFKSVVDKPFFAYINKRGEVERMEDTENLWTGLGELGLDESAQKALKQNLQQQLLGEATLMATISQMLVTYSDKAVKQGGTWEVNNSFPIGFPVTIKDTWSVEEIAGANAFMTSDGTATSDKEKIIEIQGGMKAKADLSGRQAKKANVNVKSGWPTKTELLSEMKGTLTLLKGGMIQEDMQIPMQVTTETSFTIGKK
jgi:hypothetical protein